MNERLIDDEWMIADIEYPPESEMSEETRDLISRLLEYDPKKRLGHNGIEEIKKHPFFKSVCWEKLLKQPGAFVPKLQSDTDTSYFGPSPSSLFPLSLSLFLSFSLSLFSLLSSLFSLLSLFLFSLSLSVCRI